MIVGPLDNHDGAGAGRSEDHYGSSLAWKSEAQAQLPLLRDAYAGHVFWTEAP